MEFEKIEYFNKSKAIISTKLYMPFISISSGGQFRFNKELCKKFNFREYKFIKVAYLRNKHYIIFSLSKKSSSLNFELKYDGAVYVFSCMPFFKTNNLDLKEARGRYILREAIEIDNNLKEIYYIDLYDKINLKNKE